jgi:hypothetical protein
LFSCIFNNFYEFLFILPKDRNSGNKERQQEQGENVIIPRASILSSRDAGTSVGGNYNNNIGKK